jgi:hypothetical protein
MNKLPSLNKNLKCLLSSLHLHLRLPQQSVHLFRQMFWKNLL